MARIRTAQDLPPVYRVTLVSVFLLTVVFDPTVAVEFGICRLPDLHLPHLQLAGRAESAPPTCLYCYRGQRRASRSGGLHGALFFGATKLLEAMEDHLPAQALVLDLKNVIYADRIGAEALENLAHACATHGVRLIVSGLMGQPLDILRRTGTE